MAFDPTDFLTLIISHPQYLFIPFFWVSGYVLFRLLYGGSTYFHRPSAERWIIGGILGGWLVLTTMPLIDMAIYATAHIHVDATYLALESSFVLVFFVLLLWVNKIMGVSDYSLCRIFLVYPIGLSIISLCVMIAVSIVGFEVQYYPDNVMNVITGFWKDFRQGGLWLTIISSIPMYVILHPRVRDLTQNVPTLRFPGSRPPNRISLFKESIHRIWNMRVIRYSLAGLLVVLIVSSLVVPIDLQMNAFTPRLHAGHESFYAQEGCGDAYSDLLLIRNYDGDYLFYQKMKLNYNVTLPWLYRFDTSVSVENPSNFSAYTRESMPYGDAWLYISPGDSAGVSYSYTLIDGKVTRITANLTAVANSTAQFTLSYYNQFLKRNVDYSESDNSTRIDNNTVLERHSFVIINQEKICVAIPRIQFDKLNYEGVNVTLARVYVNGELQNVGVEKQLGFFPWTIVMPGATANITLTFLTKLS